MCGGSSSLYVSTGVSPMPVMVEKLILEFEANGRANFPRFVRAFEDYFASITVPADPVPAKDEYYPGREEAIAAMSGTIPCGCRCELCI